jgi:hypothetical protein
MSSGAHSSSSHRASTRYRRTVTDGKRILAALQEAGVADAGLHYESVMAELANGAPPLLALLGPGASPIGERVIAIEQRKLIDELLSIARGPWTAAAPPPEPTVPWARLAVDLAQSTGRTLALTFRWEAFPDHGYWVCDLALGGRRRGGCSFDGDDDPEGGLANLADRLCEGWLHEEVWGGWPMCPKHPDRPMWAGLSEGGVAVWRCEADARDEIEIGQLGLGLG